MKKLISILAAVTFFVGTASAQTYTEAILYSFGLNSVSGGSNPFGTLIQASDGNFYGSLDDPLELTDGAIFRITPSGQYSIVYQFTGGPDGANPEEGLIEGPDGALYGTTSSGGAGYRIGTVFRLTLDGQVTPLFTFTGDNTGIGGFGAADQLTLGSDGWLYGVIPDGGDSSTLGSIFKISTDGKYVALQGFNQTDSENYSYGDFPGAPLIEVTPGTFLGADDGGGTARGSTGTLFTITSAGALTESNCFFHRDAPGYPVPSSFVEAADGNVYSFDSNGLAATNATNGTIFKVSPEGELSTIHNMQIEEGSGLTGLILGSDGLLYGTAYGAGPETSAGTLFSATTAGSVHVLYNFGPQPGPDGENPFAPIQGADGNFYGLAENGGADSVGAIYRIAANPALPAPVQLNLSAGQVAVGSPVTLNWKVLNAVSVTAQQCYGFVQGQMAGAGGFSGKQVGTYADGVYSGSEVFKPTATGTFTYALTCGGVESGFATLTVTGKNAPAATGTNLTRSAPFLFTTDIATLTATVSSSVGTPTGKVIFYANGAPLATVSLVNGVATLKGAAKNYPPGTYDLTAAYQGNTSYTASASQPLQILLLPKQVPVVFGIYDTEATDFTTGSAKVAASLDCAYEFSSPTGTVNFYINGTYSGTGQIQPDEGFGFSYVSATLDVSEYNPGTYSLTAVYSGDATHAEATAASMPLYVNVHPSNTWFYANPPTVTQPQSVTLTATVTDALDNLVPTPAKVTFFVNGVAAVSAMTNTKGVATITLPSSDVSPGVYALYAEYEGNATFGASVSSRQNVGVK
jgi:uncharacterized repeat protein (TIGR03803 family)